MALFPLPQASPSCFIGDLARLEALVGLLCDQMSETFRDQGLSLPPWRTPSAMLSKWSPRDIQQLASKLAAAGMVQARLDAFNAPIYSPNGVAVAPAPTAAAAAAAAAPGRPQLASISRVHEPMPMHHHHHQYEEEEEEDEDDDDDGTTVDGARMRSALCGSIPDLSCLQQPQQQQVQQQRPHAASPSSPHPRCSLDRGHHRPASSRLHSATPPHSHAPEGTGFAQLASMPFASSPLASPGSSHGHPPGKQRPSPGPPPISRAATESSSPLTEQWSDNYPVGMISPFASIPAPSPTAEERSASPVAPMPNFEALEPVHLQPRSLQQQLQQEISGYIGAGAYPAASPAHLQTPAPLAGAGDRLHGDANSGGAAVAARAYYAADSCSGASAVIRTAGSDGLLFPVHVEAADVGSIMSNGHGISSGSNVQQHAAEPTPGSSSSSASGVGLRCSSSSCSEGEGEGSSSAASPASMGVKPVKVGAGKKTKSLLAMALKKSAIAKQAADDQRSKVAAAAAVRSHHSEPWGRITTIKWNVPNSRSRENLATLRRQASSATLARCGSNNNVADAMAAATSKDKP